MKGIEKAARSSGRRAFGAWVLAGAVVIGLGALARPSSAKAPLVAAGVTTFFGEETVAAIAGAGGVEIARLQKNAAGDAYVVESVQRIGGDLLKGFRETLVSAGTYDLPARGEADAKLCASFEPAVLVRFARPRKPPVDVLLCFKCNEAGVAVSTLAPKKLARGMKYGATPNLRADMGPGHLRLLQLVVRAFPKDRDFGAVLAEQSGGIP